ncbi:MAG: hypothetical protein IPG46_20455 [Actinobacteria bacterium]|nr:hypothetical protein [Actinomycetota bacterium]
MKRRIEQFRSEVDSLKLRGSSGQGEQRSLVVGVVLTVALFVRYSIARYLRFWLIRLTYEGRANTDRIVDAIERAAGLPSTLEAPANQVVSPPSET